jgi:hypothetical protein
VQLPQDAPQARFWEKFRNDRRQRVPRPNGPNPIASTNKPINTARAWLHYAKLDANIAMRLMKMQIALSEIEVRKDSNTELGFLFPTTRV